MIPAMGVDQSVCLIDIWIKSREPVRANLTAQPASGTTISACPDGLLKQLEKVAIGVTRPSQIADTPLLLPSTQGYRIRFLPVPRPVRWIRGTVLRLSQKRPHRSVERERVVIGPGISWSSRPIDRFAVGQVSNAWSRHWFLMR